MQVTTLWKKAALLQAAGVEEHLARHDAIGSLELIERLDAEGWRATPAAA